MRVVPRGAVLGSPEAIHLAAAVGRDGALSHAVGAVMDVGVALVHAVPVDRGAVRLEAVDDGDLEMVTPVGLKGRANDLAVDHHDLVLLDTIGTSPVVGLGEGESILGECQSCCCPSDNMKPFTYPSGLAGVGSSELIVGVDAESWRPTLPVGRRVATASETTSKTFGHEILPLINGSEEVIASGGSTKDDRRGKKARNEGGDAKELHGDDEDPRYGSKERREQELLLL